MRTIAGSWAAAALLLTGCAPVSVQTYPGPAKAGAEIATLKGISAEAAGTGRTYSAHFASYARYTPGAKPHFDKAGDSITGYPRELTMLPGRYVILAYCTSAGGYAFPAIRLELAAGDVYELKCEPVPDELSRVRVVARLVGHGAPRAFEAGSEIRLEDLPPISK